MADAAESLRVRVARAGLTVRQNCNRHLLARNECIAKLENKVTWLVRKRAH